MIINLIFHFSVRIQIATVAVDRMVQETLRETFADPGVEFMEFIETCRWKQNRRHVAKVFRGYEIFHGVPPEPE